MAFTATMRFSSSSSEPELEKRRCERDIREADLKPLLHTVTAFPVSAGERGVCPKACRCIYCLHLTGGSLVELRVSLHSVHSVTEGEFVGVGCRAWFGIGPHSGCFSIASKAASEPLFQAYYVIECRRSTVPISSIL